MPFLHCCSNQVVGIVVTQVPGSILNILYVEPIIRREGFARRPLLHLGRGDPFTSAYPASVRTGLWHKFSGIGLENFSPAP